MRLGKLDLNLLIALDALLQERGVSLAADRLNMSQSAASGALARLRDYFRDDLLVLQGRSMVLTPRAEKLIDPVHSVLEQIRATIMVAEPFEPATSDRTLSIMATDYIFEILLRPAIVACATDAPGIRFELVPIVEHPVEALQRGRADILIGIDNVISTGHPSELLYTEDFVIAGWRDNPLLTDPMTLERYEDLGHVAVRFGQQTSSYEAVATRLHSVARRVEVIAPNFSSVGGPAGRDKSHCHHSPSACGAPGGIPAAHVGGTAVRDAAGPRKCAMGIAQRQRSGDRLAGATPQADSRTIAVLVGRAFGSQSGCLRNAVTAGTAAGSSFRKPCAPSNSCIVAPSIRPAMKICPASLPRPS